VKVGTLSSTVTSCAYCSLWTYNIDWHRFALQLILEGLPTLLPLLVTPVTENDCPREDSLHGKTSRGRLQEGIAIDLFYQLSTAWSIASPSVRILKCRIPST
jgi:hypothetical protein